MDSKIVGLVITLGLLMSFITPPFRYTLFKTIDVEKAKALASIKYEARRALIKELCSNLTLSEEDGTGSYWNTWLYFDYKHHLLYCGVPKAGTSTLAKVKKKIMKTMKGRFDLRKQLFPLRNKTMFEANDQLLSFTFVRDPFDRLMSCYTNKMAKKWHPRRKELRFMRDEIMVKYRHVNPNTTYDAPTPTEFVQYVIDKVDQLRPASVNDHIPLLRQGYGHIMPMWASCPFCSLNFDVIGHLETWSEDANFIISTMNLDISSQSTHKNTAIADKYKSQARRAFQDSLSEELKRDFYRVFELDFLMFGYPNPFKKD